MRGPTRVESACLYWHRPENRRWWEYDEYTPVFADETPGLVLESYRLDRRKFDKSIDRHDWLAAVDRLCLKIDPAWTDINLYDVKLYHGRMISVETIDGEKVQGALVKSYTPRHKFRSSYYILATSIGFRIFPELYLESMNIVPDCLERYETNWKGDALSQKQINNITYWMQCSTKVRYAKDGSENLDVREGSPKVILRSIQAYREYAGNVESKQCWYRALLQTYEWVKRAEN